MDAFFLLGKMPQMIVWNVLAYILAVVALVFLALLFFGVFSKGEDQTDRPIEPKPPIFLSKNEIDILKAGWTKVVFHLKGGSMFAWVSSEEVIVFMADEDVPVHLRSRDEHEGSWKPLPQNHRDWIIRQGVRSYPPAHIVLKYTGRLAAQKTTK